MRYTILLSFLVMTSLGADELSFGEGSKPLPLTSKTRTHVIQLNSNKQLEAATNSLKKVPDKYRLGMAIYHIGDYYATRYIDIYDPASIPMVIEDFKKSGFNDPITFTYNPNRVPITLKNSSQNIPLASKEIPLKTSSVALSQYDKTKLLLDAQNAYQKHDYSQATIYYEMMVAAGFKDKQILINLCYLYGREGSSSMMERAIANKRGNIDYLYAYGFGALETGVSDLYAILSPHLIYDKSGRLAILCASFFERQGNSARAKSLYKMAYEANPNDPHILYAYARNVDMSGDKEKAIYLYTGLTQLGSDYEALRSASISRINLLRSIQ
ncbi:MAG: tetratricopeptide repeat protein [Campylobacterales bacterium]|nr:tetratricopeptide repeat protein [Campylobacterales bacterium]